MAVNKSRLTIGKDTRGVRDKTSRKSTGGLLGLDPDGDSVVSFQALDARPAIKFAWAAGNDKVNYDTYHRMVEEYNEAKRKETELGLKTKQLAAQLARTEEAAKRALVETDPTAKGGAAQKLLNAERDLAHMRDENAKLRSKLARAEKAAADNKVAYEDARKRLEAAQKDQRIMARKVGELQRQVSMVSRKPEDEFWSEESGRRYAQQQDELCNLREENQRLHTQLAQMQEFGVMPPGGEGAAGGAHGVPETAAYQAQIDELTKQLKYYEKKMAAVADLPAQDGGSAGIPSPDDWILEDYYHDNNMYLLDRNKGKGRLFTVPTENAWPRPVGYITNTKVQLGSGNKMERLINTLDNYVKDHRNKLEEVFKEFDLNGNGSLDRREMARMIVRLMPELQGQDMQIMELQMMLDYDSDGVVTLQELMKAIKESYDARMAAKVGRSLQVNEHLERVRDVLRSNKKLVRVAFDEMDKAKTGTLSHVDVIQLIRTFIKDMDHGEVRYVLAKLQEWDVTGEGKTSLDEIYQALELVRIYRVGQGQGGRARPVSPGRAVSPGRESFNMASYKAAERPSAAQALKEGFLKERMAQLEAELAAAQRREGVLEEDAQKVDILRKDLAFAKAHIEKLEKDYMKLDVLAHLNAASAAGDQKLSAAWEAASQYKQRFMEYKGELDTVRLAAVRMQAQLEETHRLLHEEHKRRCAMEDENTQLKLQLQRAKDLETQLNNERGQRRKIERELFTLQNQALGAPGTALGEVRQLREELFALRRDKALAEQKEAEVRRELSAVREQLDGMSPDQYRAWQRGYEDLKKRVVTLELELQAANDKLEVYRRTDNSGVANIVFGNTKDAPSWLDRRPDADKNEDEIRRELAQLRDVWHADQQELKKLHKVLETESAQTLEAKAALEEAHREMDRLRRDLQDQLRSMQRELDRRDERIRKLELQLRGAYSGINRALRSSRLRDSRATDSPDDLSELGDDQNLLELHISEATLYEEALGKDPSTFFTFDFFMHETQATPVMASNTPVFNTLVQYVVDSDTFLLEYLDTHVLELELNRARGWDYDTVGVARVTLRQILEDVEIGAALGHNRAYHYADVHGADGRRVGRVRYGFAFRRPLDGLLKDYRLTARGRGGKRPSEPDPRDPATGAVALAQGTPSAASHIKIIVARAEQLVPPSGAGPNTRPYVWFRFPGHRDPHSSRMLYGTNPVYNDESTWLIARTPELEHSLRTREMEFVVFDDAGGEDPLRCIVGVAFVPLAALAQGMPVEGSFRLLNPVTKQPSGKLILGMGWHNPLALPQPGAGNPAASTARGATGMMAAAGGKAGGPQPPAGVYGGDVLNDPRGVKEHVPPLSASITALPPQQQPGISGRPQPGAGAGAAAQGRPALPQFPPRHGIMAPAPGSAAAPQQPPYAPQPPGPTAYTPYPAGASQQLQPPSHGLAAEMQGGLGLRGAAAGGLYVPPRVPENRLAIPTAQPGPGSAGLYPQQPQQQPVPGNTGYGLAAEAMGPGGTPLPAYAQSPALPQSGRPQSPPFYDPGLAAGIGPGGYGAPAQQQQQVAPAMPGSPLPGSMLLGASGAGAVGRSRYDAVEQSASPPSLARPRPGEPVPPGQCFCQLSPDPSTWPPSSTHVILALESVTLEPSALAGSSRDMQYVFVMHALMEEVATSMEDTCTRPVFRQPGALLLNYAVAYKVAGLPGDTAAARGGAEMGARLRSPEGAFLDLRLFESRDPGALNLAAIGTGGIRSLGVAEVSVTDIASGRAGDLVRRQVAVVREETGERVATLVITFMAEAAVRPLMAPPAGTAGNPMAAAAGRAPGVGSSMQSVTGYPGYY